MKGGLLLADMPSFIYQKAMFCNFIEACFLYFMLFVHDILSLAKICLALHHCEL